MVGHRFVIMKPVLLLSFRVLCLRIYVHCEQLSNPIQPTGGSEKACNNVLGLIIIYFAENW